MKVIEVNNGRHIALDLTEKGLTVMHFDDKGKLERVDRYGEADLVSLCNWASYQKENGNPALMF